MKMTIAQSVNSQAKFLRRPQFYRRVLSAVAILRKPSLALACAAAASISVAAKNLPPTAQNLSIIAAANLGTPIVLQGSDPNGDALTFTLVAFPSRGTLSGTAPNLIYTPFFNFLGTDSFSYAVSDGRLTSSSATVHITVKPGLSINN